MASYQDLKISIGEYHILVLKTYHGIIGERELYRAWNNLVKSDANKKDISKLQAFTNILADEYMKQYSALNGIEHDANVTINKLQEWMEFEYAERIREWIENNDVRQQERSYANEYPELERVVPVILRAMFSFKWLIMIILYMTTYQCIVAGALPKPMGASSSTEFQSVDEITWYLTAMMRTHKDNYLSLDLHLQNIMIGEALSERERSG